MNKLRYKYAWFDAEAAALAREKDPTMRDRLPFIKKEELEIYPDTTVWIKDFNYSYNEPMHNDYFSHPAYQDYPVVGVSWKQAVAFVVGAHITKTPIRKKKINHLSIILDYLQKRSGNTQHEAEYPLAPTLGGRHTCLTIADAF